MAFSDLAVTTFKGGVDKTLAVVDVYKKNTQEVINSIQEKSKEIGVELLPIINATSPKAIGDMITKSIDNALVVNKDAILGRLMGAGSDLQTAFRSLDAGIKAGFNIVGDLSKSITGTINGVTSAINSVKLDSIKGIATMVGNLTNGKFIMDLVDRGAISGLISGLTNEAHKLGITGVFTAISQTVKDTRILIDAAKNIIPNAIKTVVGFKDMALSTIGKELKNIVPNITKNFISNFKLAAGTLAKDFIKEALNTKTAILAVEPDYGMCTRADSTESILDASLRSTPSPDFNKIFNADALSKTQVIPEPVNGVVTMPVYADDASFMELANPSIGTLFSKATSVFSSLPSLADTIIPQPFKESDSTVPISTYVLDSAEKDRQAAQKLEVQRLRNSTEEEAFMKEESYMDAKLEKFWKAEADANAAVIKPDRNEQVESVKDVITPVVDSKASSDEDDWKNKFFSKFVWKSNSDGVKVLAVAEPTTLSKEEEDSLKSVNVTRTVTHKAVSKAENYVLKPGELYPPEGTIIGGASAGMTGNRFEFVAVADGKGGSFDTSTSYLWKE